MVSQNSETFYGIIVGIIIILGSFLILSKKSQDNEQEVQEVKEQSDNVEEDYELGEELGHGAFGTVVKGKDKYDGTIYAVKMVQRKGMTEEDEEDLANEVTILKRMKHKYVMNLIRYYEMPECHYLVTELLVGGELFDRIEKKQHYSEKEARDAMFVFCDAMSYIHSQKVVHRDLKPENLLLVSKEDDLHLKIADFGLSAIVNDSEQLTDIAGTPLYMSPEMLLEQPYSYSTDVWSMGCICYILLGGYPPFYANNIETLLSKVKNCQYDFDETYWGHISSEAKDLIKMMLEPDPQKRITVDDALQHTWIRTSDEALLSRRLEINHREFKLTNARRKLRAATKAIMAMNTLQHKHRIHAAIKSHE